MGWKHYQTVDPRNREPLVARGLFGIRLLILHFKFQFSKSIKSSTFHILIPLLEYACPIWGGIPDYLSLELQRVQDRAVV